MSKLFPQIKAKIKLQQTFLDFGQKNLFARLCECGFLVDPSFPSDEARHRRFHNQHLDIFRADKVPLGIRAGL